LCDICEIALPAKAYFSNFSGKPMKAYISCIPFGVGRPTYPQH